MVSSARSIHTIRWVEWLKGHGHEVALFSLVEGDDNLWCGEALETLHTIELDLEGGLEQGFLSRMGRKFRRWAT